MNRKTLRKIAKKHGVTPKEVKADMEAAIQQAYTDPNRNLVNIKAQNAVERKGDIPTVDELVRHVVKETKKQYPTEEA